jgi:voltage-gated potassium channel
MLKERYNKTIDLIEKRRYLLLLLSTILVLVLPAFSGSGLLSEFLFVITISFLFIQSMIAANVRQSRKRLIRFIVIALILVTWLKPVGIDSIYIDLFKLVSIATFFIFVVIYLIKFMARSTSVNVNVLITSVNIYLLAGIISASLAFIFYLIYPNAYNFPGYIDHPVYVHFIYYSFITMSTVGYGDITPRIPETQTLAYLISITGQLYMAIIIAFLIGKFLMQSSQNKTDQGNERND